MRAADASPGLREGESLAQITQLSLNLAFDVLPKLVVGIPVPPFLPPLLSQAMGPRARPSTAAHCTQ